jgi:hypothetical protein
MGNSILEMAGPHFFDAAFIANERKIPLLSDDLRYRAWSATAVGGEGPWLQSALMAALGEGQVSMPDYAAAVVNLAARRHGHVSLTGEVLLQIASNDNDDLIRLCAALHYIGGKTAEITSHFVVVINLITRLWDPDLDMSPLRRRAATGLALEALLRNRDADGLDWLRRVVRFVPRSVSLNRYFRA